MSELPVFLAAFLGSFTGMIAGLIPVAWYVKKKLDNFGFGGMF